MQAVHVDAAGGTMGAIQELRITDAHANSLTGAPVNVIAGVPGGGKERVSA
jgi:hypothetical protein